MGKLTSKKALGKSGMEVAPIIFGTSCLGNLYQALDDETKLSIEKEWFEHVEAPVVIDTAGKYGAGLALEVIGNGLRKMGIPQDKIIISNKLGWTRVPLTTPEPTFEPGVWADLKYDAIQNISYGGIIECYHQGLELLGGGYNTDIVSVHDPDEYLAASGSDEDRKKRFEDIVGAYTALNELKAEGKVKAVGVGSKDWKVIRELAEFIDLDWVMLAVSFTVMTHPPEILDFIKDLTDKNIGIINSAVFHGGFLTGGDFFDYRKVEESNPEDKKLFKWRADFNALCGKHGVKPAAACVAFGMTPPGVVSIALNTSQPKRVAQNTELVAAVMPDAFWKELKVSGLIDKSYPFI